MDVDLGDLPPFGACGTGPAGLRATTLPCLAADQNLDGHVDLADFADFQRCFSGDGVTSPAGCAVRPIRLGLMCPAGMDGEADVVAGDDLHKVTIRRADAICNDGSPAVMYIRRAADPSHLTQWVFHLQAGGACTGGPSCVIRWCGVNPPYHAGKMSSLYNPDAMNGSGIFARGVSALANANLVFLYYCSSDAWRGRHSVVVLGDEAFPDVTFSLHFRGHSIIEAALDILMSGSTTSDDGLETVPPLSAATSIVWSGSSAGSAGAVQHLDWVRGHFSPEQTRIVGLFDAAQQAPFEFYADPVDREQLEIQEANDSPVVNGPERFNSFLDESCVAHRLPQGDEWRCAGGGHLLLNHVTTPFFVRMDLTDSNVVDENVSIGVTPDDFAMATQAMMLALPNIQNTAVEADAIDFVPGVFGPNCGQHIVLMNGGQIHQEKVDDSSGTSTSVYEAIIRWLQGQEVFAVDEHPAVSSICPP